MNTEDELYSHFILNQKQSRAPKRKIYTVKYFSLMITMTIARLTTEIKYKKLFQNAHTFDEEILYIISITMIFLISSFTQSIGHRRLYILIYIQYSVLYILIEQFGLFPPPWIITLIIITKLMLYVQIIIQIYGTWPHIFSRVMAELIFFQEVVRVSVSFDFNLEVINWILIAMIIVNFVCLISGYFSPIFISINDFKSPDTDSVFRDFRKLLFNRKIGIFTLLYFISKLSTGIYSLYLTKIFKELEQHYFTYFLSPFTMILIRLLVNLNRKASLMILSSLILLVNLLMTLILQFQINYFIFVCLYIIYLVIILGWDVYMTPQYWQIQLSIGIRNLDFVASFQLISFGYTFPINFYILNQNNQISQYIDKNLQIITLTLIVIIISLSFIFYQLLGFKQYLKNTNMAQVEEDRFQIEIV